MFNADESHVEERRKHECETGDEDGADELEDGAEAGERHRQEAQDDHDAGPEQQSLQVEC